MNLGTRCRGAEEQKSRGVVAGRHGRIEAQGGVDAWMHGGLEAPWRNGGCKASEAYWRPAGVLQTTNQSNEHFRDIISRPPLAIKQIE